MSSLKSSEALAIIISVFVALFVVGWWLTYRYVKRLRLFLQENEHSESREYDAQQF